MKELKGSSKNITEENISAMKQLFPEAFAEGKIDFDVLSTFAEKLLWQGQDDLY